MKRRTFTGGAVLAAAGLLLPQPPARAAGKRAGRVRLDGHALVDDGGPFLGLGVSYFTALHRCKHDRPRLERDLAFLAAQGFNYYRMLSMVGWYGAWDGLEIAPVTYTSREGKRVEAWPDYWQQLRELIDLAYDRYGLRTQVTLFADAQLMPGVPARREHMRRFLADVVAGREQKLMLIEVANEAWQNGFPGDEGVAELRDHTRYLAERTGIPIAITSNHEDSFEKVYKDSAADIATWHFSRDRRKDEGWDPVYDCWRFGHLPGIPPASSNEPIGPGASVSTERDPLRLVMAAAFAYAAKLPMYVFHCEAGVFGKSRFEETPAIGQYRPLLRMLPSDLPGWERNDGKEPRAPFTAFAGGAPNRYRLEGETAAPDGCIRNTGSRKGDRFVCVPIGIRGGLTLQAREKVSFQAHHPLTGEALRSVALAAGERVTLDAEPGALVLMGRVD
ncbi:MAG: hypothetical protein ACK47B_17630 [Armatimonadota bacterium]